MKSRWFGSELGFFIACLDVDDDSLVFDDGQVLFDNDHAKEVERYTITAFVNRRG